MDKEFVNNHFLNGLITNGLISSAHDVSEGGLFVTLFECGMTNNLGFDITTDSDIREDAFLFGEGQGRIVITVKPDTMDDFLDFLEESNITCTLLGHVTKGEMRVDDVPYGTIGESKTIYENALKFYLDKNEKQ
jgi:phosphoribosylformylglycinamidine synthase